MADPLEYLLAELEQFGKVNDSSTNEHRRRCRRLNGSLNSWAAVLGSHKISGEERS